MRYAKLLPALLLAACAHRAGGPAAPPPPVEQAPPPDLPASFAGRLPCDGCEAIDAELHLLDPARYVLVETRLEEGGITGATTSIRGGWTIRGETLELAARRFRIEDERLVPLLPDGTEGAALLPAPAPTLLFGAIRRTTDGLRLEPCSAPDQRLEVFDATADLQRALEEMPGSFVALVATEPSEGETVALDFQRIEEEGPGCAQIPEGMVAVASGAEPFWRLEIDRRSVRLERAGQDPVGTPWAPFRWEAGAWRYWADARDTRLEVVLTPGYCTDPMAPVATGYRAEVRVDGRLLEGCAWLGTAWEALDG